jgi:hypothetical protein
MYNGNRAWPGTRTAKLEQRAQEALNELRRVLPSIIQNEHKNLNRAVTILSAIADNGSAPATAKAVFELAEELERQVTVLDKLRSLLALAADVPTLTRRTVMDWHSAAIWLSVYYKRVVGEIRISADGPAVRFIRSALYRLGWGHKELSAVAKAIRRS